MSSTSATAAIYSLKCQGRCVAPYECDRSHHRFFTATCSVRDDNEIHLIDYDEDSNEISLVQNMSLPSLEVRRIVSHPFRADLLATLHYDRQSQKHEASLWKMPVPNDVSTGPTLDDTGGTDAAATEQSNADTSNSKEVAEPNGFNDQNNFSNNSRTLQGHESVSLERLCTLPSESAHGSDTETANGSINVTAEWYSLLFSPFHSERGMATLDDIGLKLWTLSEDGAQITRVHLKSVLTPLETMSEMHAACYDPHHPSMMVVAANTTIFGFDLRTPSTMSHTIENAADDIILDIDYNPNRPYHILSTGLDRIVRLWDIRKPSAPLKMLGSHTHWVWQSRFNRFHDQLILSASSENVNLWSIVSASSAPLGDMEANASKEKDPDKLVKSYQDHEDSVYSCAWSTFDAWVFATASYDGRVVINQVPPAEKYRILLAF